jgi:hypothetical protein
VLASPPTHCFYWIKTIHHILAIPLPICHFHAIFTGIVAQDFICRIMTIVRTILVMIPTVCNFSGLFKDFASQDFSYWIKVSYS